MKTTTIGLDLAKNIFQVHGVDEHGKAATRKKLKRAEVSPYFANLPPYLIDMDDAKAICEAVARPNMRFVWG